LLQYCNVFINKIKEKTIAEKDEQKLRMIRRKMTEREKSRKQSIFVEDADEKLPDGEEVSID